jgi:hypothetical protein
MGGWCKERYNKDENNKLEGQHQKPDHIEETRWEGQNFSEVVAPEEEEEVKNMFVNSNKPLPVSVLFIRPSSGGHMPCFVPLL